MNRVRERLARIGSPVVRGAVTGMLAGVAAAVLYALFSPMVLVLSTLTAGVEANPTEAIVGSLVLPFVAAPFVALIGVLPAMVLGLFGGALIGAIVALGRGKVSPGAGLAVGVLVGILLTGAVSLAIIAFVGDSTASGPTFAYWFWLGVPGFLAMLVAGWTGRFVATTQRSAV